LIPKGWVASDEANVAAVLQPELGVAVVVTRGDEATAESMALPRTKYPRGPVTIAAVKQNRQALLFESRETNEKIISGSNEPTPLRVTWFLLLAPASDSIQLELSLPRAADEQGRIASWSERIILPAVNTDGDDFSVVEQPGHDVVVEVTRKVR